MNKAFEKILERLEEYENNDLTEHDSELCEHCKRIDCEIGMDCFICVMDKAKQIVQEVAEEYNGDWIPCSDRLPEDDYICIVTVEYPNNKTMVDYGWFDRKSVCWFVGMQEFRTSNILAWQPLPEPFKERD